MKLIHVCMLLAGISVFFHIQAYGSDCSGGWKQMPNYKSGQGGPCKMLGLDSHVGVCQPGQQFETLCDDAKGGKYRTCQGPRRCDGGNSNVAPPTNSANCSSWDYKRNRPCPNGYVNNDCYGDCESLPTRNQSQGGDCTTRDYQRKQPCPPGYRNSDCRGGCE